MNLKWIDAYVEKCYKDALLKNTWNKDVKREDLPFKDDVLQLGDFEYYMVEKLDSIALKAAKATMTLKRNVYFECLQNNLNWSVTWRDAKDLIKWWCYAADTKNFENTIAEIFLETCVLIGFFEVNYREDYNNLVDSYSSIEFLRGVRCPILEAINSWEIGDWVITQRLFSDIIDCLVKIAELENFDLEKYVGIVFKGSA